MIEILKSETGVDRKVVFERFTRFAQSWEIIYPSQSRYVTDL